MAKTKANSDTTVGEVLAAAEASHLDLDALVARVDKVIAEPLYWFPVRHHSPTIARHVAACIKERKPKVVFIEGPSEAQSMIEFLIDSTTRPPVAIYSSFRDDSVPVDPMAGGAANRKSVWYPMVSYSPEYVAMQTAKQVGARTVFMDLPHYAEPEPAQVPTPVPGANATPPRRRDLDEIAPASGFYHHLTRAAGYRSWQETWDRLFEVPRPELSCEDYRREVALFCAAVRATTPPETLEPDGTLPRERFMWRTIQSTLAEMQFKPADAMVVCGGFHIFLDQHDKKPPPPLPEGTLSVTVAPYSYFRISELSGYGAGNRAPRFYELCYDHHAAGRGQDEIVIEYIIDVLKEVRRKGEQGVSTADAIGAMQHTLMLARLRGRREPVLDDIFDALITCCCKGNPHTDAQHLLEAIDEINIGTRLGRVTDRIGRLPILGDFYDQLTKLEMEEVAAREKLVSYTLDKRQPRDAGRSAFLHRLVFLGVEVGAVEREASPFGQSIFREHWRVRWNPKIEAQLIERSLHGDTVEAAATTLLKESLGVNALEAGPACRRLVQAADMDLPQLVVQAEAATGHSIDHDDRFASLADAFTSLLLLERYAAYRGLGKDRLAFLLTRCFDRACFAVPEVASVPREQWEEVVGGLMALAEPVVQRPNAFDADLFATHVHYAAHVSTMPFLRGAFLGVLTEMRRIKAETLASELTAYVRGGADKQVVAGDFLHGVLKVSATAVLLGGKSLIGAVDELLQLATPDIFLGMVPRLRAAFETLHDRQRDTLAANVAELYGLKDTGGESLRTLTTTLGAAKLMAELDAEVAKIMNEWHAPREKV